MVKRIKKVVKNLPNRERKKIIVVGTEGDNKTERIYLSALERQQTTYHFIFAEGNETDPIKIVNGTIKRADKENIEKENGDFAVSIFDLDLKESKKKQYRQALKNASDNGVIVITSNPCFEIWYLEHFSYTTKQFGSSEEVIKELKKRIPDYQKNGCVFDLLNPLTQNAINNCKKLEKYHKEDGADELNVFRNPQTEMHKLVEIVLRDA